MSKIITLTGTYTVVKQLMASKARCAEGIEPGDVLVFKADLYFSKGKISVSLYVNDKFHCTMYEKEVNKLTQIFELN